MAVLDPLLVEELLLFKIRYLNELFLDDVGCLLVLPDHVLLFPLKLLELIGHAHNVSVQLLNLSFKFVVPFAFIHEIVFHVLVDSVNVVFAVKEII